MDEIIPSSSVFDTMITRSPSSNSLATNDNKDAADLLLGDMNTCVITDQERRVVTTSGIKEGSIPIFNHDDCCSTKQLVERRTSEGCISLTTLGTEECTSSSSSSSFSGGSSQDDDDDDSGSGSDNGDLLLQPVEEELDDDDDLASVLSEALSLLEVGDEEEENKTVSPPLVEKEVVFRNIQKAEQAQAPHIVHDLLQVDQEEQAHEEEEEVQAQEEEVQYNTEDELEDMPLDSDYESDSQAAGPIKNSFGQIIGFKKKNPLTRLLSSSTLSKSKSGSRNKKNKQKKSGNGSGKYYKYSNVSTQEEETTAEEANNHNLKVNGASGTSAAHRPPNNQKKTTKAAAPAVVPQQSQAPSYATTKVQTSQRMPMPMGTMPGSVVQKEDVPNQFQSIVLTSVVADIGMAAAEAVAQANGWDVTICISDTSGIPIAVKRSTMIRRGSPASYDMAVQKAKMAATFVQITGGHKNNSKTLDMSSTMKDMNQAALEALYPWLYIGGGVPLILNGTCCGAVGVSNGQVGLTDQQQDRCVANAAVNAMADIYWSYQVLATTPETTSSER